MRAKLLGLRTVANCSKCMHVLITEVSNRAKQGFDDDDDIGPGRFTMMII